MDTPTLATREKRLRVLFLYNRTRSDMYREVQQGNAHSAGFWGLIHLPDNGIDADFIELEQYMPRGVATFLRKYIFRNIYFVHLPLFFRFFSYDIVFTSASFGSQLVHAVCRVKKPIWVMHDFSITGFIGQGTTLKQRVFKYLVSRSAGIVTVGREETEKLKLMFPKLADRIKYIPFGVDLDFFKPQTVPQSAGVFAVGFDPDRDWKTLVAAVEGTDFEVIIATKPSRLMGITLPRNVTQKVFTQRELIDVYARASVVVLPMDTSKGVNDAMGCTTLFEAMSMGKAIVGTQTHTFASYITHGKNGLLVQEGDAEALREAIGKVLRDGELRQTLEAGARKYAVEHLDIRKVTAELAQFFRKLVP